MLPSGSPISISPARMKTHCERGVQCLAVSPGSVDTEMLAQTPFQPDMTPEDVAKVIAFAALDAPDAMTGSNVEVFG